MHANQSSSRPEAPHLQLHPVTTVTSVYVREFGMSLKGRQDPHRCCDFNTDSKKSTTYFVLVNDPGFQIMVIVFEATSIFGDLVYG